MFSKGVLIYLYDGRACFFLARSESRISVTYEIAASYLLCPEGVRGSETIVTKYPNLYPLVFPANSFIFEEIVQTSANM